MKTQTDYTQELMDEVYGFWNSPEGEGLDKAELIDTVLEKFGKKHVYALVAGNLNYQVCNGGFQQWVDNGYAFAQYNEVVDLLQTMNTKNSLAILEMIESFADGINFDVKDNGCFGDYWEDEGECEYCKGTGEVECVNTRSYYNDEDEYEEYEEEGYTECCECGGSGYTESYMRKIAEMSDDKFYEINEDWLKEVEKFLRNEPLPTVTRKDVPEEKKNDSVKYPDVHVKLVGRDGNVFSILSSVRDALFKANISTTEIDEFINEATDGDYNNLLRTCSKWVTIS